MLFAVLEKTEHALVHGKIVMRGFVKRQKRLLGLGLDGAVIDMDERVSRIVEAEQLAKGRFYLPIVRVVRLSAL